MKHLLDLILFSVFFLGIKSANAEQIKVAVLDTGFKTEYLKDINVCQNGIRDFTGTGIEDHHGHGTVMVGLINKYNKNPNVCFLILKVFGGQYTVMAGTNAIKYATEQGVKIINYSGSGDKPNSFEKTAIKKFQDKGGLFFASTGNEGLDLNKDCNRFPACYKDVNMVSNYGVFANQHKKALQINNSKFNVVTYFDKPLPGTSASTAIAVGQFLTYIYEHPK